MVQSFLALLDRLVDLFCGWRSLRQLERSGSKDFPRDLTAIYRVPLLDGGALVLESERPAWTAELERRRATRVYVADGAPGAAYCKPGAIFVFDGPRWTPRFWREGEDYFCVSGSGVVTHDPAVRARMTVWPPAWRIDINDMERAPGADPPPILATLAPLGGKFPPTDLPVPPAGAPKPAAPAPGPASTCNPVFLFYGLCFQHPAVSNLPAAAAGHPADPSQVDPLWAATQAYAGEFRLRGYKTWTKCAGTGAGESATLADMMAAFKADLATQNFCQCPEDQLVIYIGSHGCIDRTTGEAAAPFRPKKGGGRLVGWQEILDSLAAILTAPRKTYLILEACRSGHVWDPGVVPSGLRGMHVISAVSDSLTLGAYPSFMNAVLKSLTVDKAIDWTHLVALMKWYVSSWQLPAPSPGSAPYGKPKVGDLNGCQFKVQATGAKYTGTDIGNEWVFRLECDGKTHDVPEHTLNWLFTEPLSIVLYDRLLGACPTPPTSILVKLAASEVSGLDQDGSTSFTVKERCDGTGKALTVPVAVGSATATFMLQVTTTC
jgi:hypothetical protein